MFFYLFLFHVKHFLIDFFISIPYSCSWKGGITMVGEIMNTILAVIVGLGEALVGAFNSVGNIFWTGSALTLPGILALVAAGGGLLYFAFNFVKGLLSRSSR